MATGDQPLIYSKGGAKMDAGMSLEVLAKLLFVFWRPIAVTGLEPCILARH